MAAISQMTSSIAFLMRMYEFRLSFQWNFSYVRISNIPALVQKMAWRWPKMTQFTDVYIRHYVGMSWSMAQKE